MRFHLNTFADLELELVAKAFAHLGSDEQAKFLAVAYREMATYTKEQPDGTIKELNEWGRDMQLAYIHDEFDKHPDAREFIRALVDDDWDETGESELETAKNTVRVAFAAEESVGCNPADYELAVGVQCEQLTVIEDGKFTPEGVEYFEARAPHGRTVRVPMDNPSYFEVGDYVKPKGVGQGRVVEILDDAVVLAVGPAPLTLGDHVRLKGDPNPVTWIVQRLHNDGTVGVVCLPIATNPATVTMAADDLERVAEQAHIDNLPEAVEVLDMKYEPSWSSPTGLPRTTYRCRPRRPAPGMPDPYAPGDRVYLDMPRAAGIRVGRCTAVNNDGTIEVLLNIPGPGDIYIGVSSNDDKAPESPNADKPKCGECGGTGVWTNPAGGRNADSPCSRGCPKP